MLAGRGLGQSGPCFCRVHRPAVTGRVEKCRPQEEAQRFRADPQAPSSGVNLIAARNGHPTTGVGIVVRCPSAGPLVRPREDNGYPVQVIHHYVVWG